MRQCTVIIGRTHHGDGRTTQHEASGDFKTFVGSMSFDRELHFCRERGKYFYLFYFYFLWIWVITNKKRKFYKSFVDKIYFIRKVCKRCKTFEYLRELFLDYFFESLIFCGYISFSQLPRNKVSKRYKHYLYVYPSYFNFVVLRFFNIKNTKYQY